MVIALLFVTCVVLAACARLPAAQEAADVVWQPYLQNLTDTSVVVLWATAGDAEPAVRYVAGDNDEASVEGSSRPLDELDIVLHRVELTGLRPNTRYDYEIFADGEELETEEEFSFRTAPSPGDAEPFTFIALGDFGKGSEAQRRLRDQMERDDFDFIVTTGDNAYASGRYSEFDDRVFRIYRDVFPHAPLFPALGNHDYLDDDGEPYLDLFELPRNAWRREDVERYYSFDYGNAHFVVLDSNRPLWEAGEEEDDDMFDWLRSDLAETTQPWKIVALHHPVYDTGAYADDPEVEHIRTELVPIFEEYGVDLVLAGHEHNYQRSKPLRGGEVTTVEDGGIVYVITGAGDVANYSCSGEADWLAISYCLKRFGLYNRITVDGDRLSVAAIDAGGAVRDCFTLGREASVADGPPEPPPGARTVTQAFGAEADARIRNDHPRDNFGDSESLRVDGDDEEEERTYLRFRVAGVRGRVESASLWLFAQQGSPRETKLYETDNDWAEDELTWVERPNRVPDRIDRVDDIRDEAWVKYDVTSLVAGDGTYSFVLVSDSPDGVTFSSSEGSAPPRLLVRYTGALGSSLGEACAGQ